MKELTIEELARLIDKYGYLLGPDAKVKIQFGNGYDRPELEIGKDEYGVKFLIIC